MKTGKKRNTGIVLLLKSSKKVRRRGGLVVSTLDYESWGREFKSHRRKELLTSKKAASESTQL